MPTWEEWTEDIVAVLNATRSRHAAILATLDAGPIAILYAAMHPEAVSALILFTRRLDTWRRTTTQSG
jgi:pimeloyl-ACP methyl ester carboxylesterase